MSLLVKSPSDAGIEFVIDGGGLPISIGQKGHIPVPFDCTIQYGEIEADQVGDIVVDIWRSTYAGFPPVIGGSITAGNPLTMLPGNQKAKDATLTGWTKVLSKGDVLAFNVNSATTVTRVTINLAVRKV